MDSDVLLFGWVNAFGLLGSDHPTNTWDGAIPETISLINHGIIWVEKASKTTKSNL